jgi:hypothetical protein
MVDYQTVSIVFAGLSIGLAAIYYMLNLRYIRRNQELQQETRQAQFFMQTYQSVMTPENQRLHGEVLEWEWTDFDDFSERYYKNPTRKGEWISANITFDILGIMLKENLMDPEILFEMEQSGTRGGTVLWYKFEPIVREMRRRESNPDLLKNFEYYVEEMYKLRRLKGLSMEWSPENVWWFEK